MLDPLLRWLLCCFFFPVSSHSTSAFPTFGLGRRTQLLEQRFQFEAFFRSCRYSFMFRPPTLLATLIAPTITYFNVQQLWLLLPNTPRFVTSPCPGYTSRPNRAIDGRGLSPHKTYSLVGCPPNHLLHLTAEAVPL